MEIVESIEKINKWLDRDYGRHTDGRPWFRVVFAYDQLEKRIMTHTDVGIQLLFPEVREVPKYRHYIDHKMYILERIVTILPGVETDLVEREPYEVLWTFMDGRGNYLPPQYAACKMIIDQVFENKRAGVKKYKNPEDEIPDKDKLSDMMKYLWGDITAVEDHLALGTGVVVPGNYVRNDKKGKEDDNIDRSTN